MAASVQRVYCSVYGCLNSTVIKPTLSFFQLPADAERRSKWLRLISREDLLQKKPRCYRVCEEHFNEHDILPGPLRKKIKNTALPSFNLPNLQKNDKETQTIDVTQTCKFVQTEKISNTIYTQTSASISANTPRKRKLKSDLSKCRKKIKLNEISAQNKNDQKDTFYKLCDKFLTKELAMLVKAQTDLK